MFVSVAEECARGEGESSWILVSSFSLILPVPDYQWLIYALCEKLHIGIYLEKNASVQICEIFNECPKKRAQEVINFCTYSLLNCEQCIVQ